MSNCSIFFLFFSYYRTFMSSSLFLQLTGADRGGCGRECDGQVFTLPQYHNHKYCPGTLEIWLGVKTKWHRCGQGGFLPGQEGHADRPISQCHLWYNPKEKWHLSNVSVRRRRYTKLSSITPKLSKPVVPSRRHAEISNICRPELWAVIKRSCLSPDCCKRAKFSEFYECLSKWMRTKCSISTHQTRRFVLYSFLHSGLASVLKRIGSSKT